MSMCRVCGKVANDHFIFPEGAMCEECRRRVIQQIILQTYELYAVHLTADIPI